MWVLCRRTRPRFPGPNVLSRPMKFIRARRSRPVICRLDQALKVNSDAGMNLRAAASRWLSEAGHALPFERDNFIQIGVAFKQRQPFARGHPDEAAIGKAEFEAGRSRKRVNDVAHGPQTHNQQLAFSLNKMHHFQRGSGHARRPPHASCSGGQWDIREAGTGCILPAWRTTREFAPVGPVASSSVAPNTTTVGTPNAELICMAPESLVSMRRHAATISMNVSSLVLPARLRASTPPSAYARSNLLTDLKLRFANP